LQDTLAKARCMASSWLPSGVEIVFLIEALTEHAHVSKPLSFFFCQTFLMRSCLASFSQLP